MMWATIKRWRWAIGIVGLLVGALIYSFWPVSTAVDQAAVTRGPMQVGITDDGITRIHDVYTVSAPVTGYVTRIDLEAGDSVVAHRTIIVRMAGAPSTPLDVRTREELRDGLRAARAAEAGAAAALELAQSDLRRAEQLAERGFLSKSRLEAATALVKTRGADVQRLRAERDRLQAALAEPAISGTPRAGSIVVRSPESGVVLRRLNVSEGMIPMGTPLVEIGDRSRIEVVIDLLSRDAAKVKPGAPVEITRWGEDRPLFGKVRLVEPFGQMKVSALGVEEQRVNVIVDLDPRAAAVISQLGHGYQLDGTIILWREQDVLRAPVGALFHGEDGGWRVFVNRDGRAVTRAVRIGHINDQYAEVLDGLKEGDRVVLNPGGLVDEGTRIRRRT